MTLPRALRLSVVAAALAVAGLSLSALPPIAAAQSVAPQPGAGDPRIRTVVYNPYQVVTLRGHLGYQIMIEFAANERIENVSIGDSLSWQVTPNQKANLLFVKPVDRSSGTNMTVVTNQRRYAFELVSSEARGPSDPNIIYVLRFAFPEGMGPRVIEVTPPPPPAPTGPAISSLNFNYGYSGARRLQPVRVFDDGAVTYFEFKPEGETPAIYAIGDDGRESLVNLRSSERYMIVDQLAPSFALRLGNERMVVRNETYPAARR